MPMGMGPLVRAWSGPSPAVMTKASGGGGGGTNTWDPATLGPGMALDAPHLTATHTGATNGCVKGTASRSSGTPSYDVTFDIQTSVGIGMCDGTFNTANGLGSDAHAFAMTPGDGLVYISGSPVGNCGVTGAPGTRFSLRYNVGAATVQYAANGGAYGTAVDISSMSPGALFPCCSADTNGTTFLLDPTLWV